MEAIKIIKTEYSNMDAQQDYFHRCLTGISHFLCQPSILKTIKEVARLFNQYGVVSPEKINLIVERRLINNINRPQIVDIAQSAYKGLFHTEDLLNNIDPNNPEYANTITCANMVFATGLIRLSLDEEYSFDNRFFWLATDSIYWK